MYLLTDHRLFLHCAPLATSSIPPQREFPMKTRGGENDSLFMPLNRPAGSGQEPRNYQ
jgi:hypothetical protein